MHESHDSTGFDATAVRNRSHSSWGKGCLLGLCLAGCVFWVIAAAATPNCALDSFTGSGFVSLNVGGFSLFISWSGYGCR